MIKILKPNDAKYFESALDDYYENTDHLKSGFIPEERKQWINDHKMYFNLGLHKEYVVVGEFIDDCLVGLAIGFVNDFLIKRATGNILSGWHLAFTWKKSNVIEWKSPKKFMFDITNPISLHMENLGIYDFTKIMRVNLINLKNVGVHEYIQRVYNKNIPDGRYDAYAEYIVQSSDDVQKLPFIYKKHCPTNIVTPLMCVRHSLKNEIRNTYLVNKIK